MESTVAAVSRGLLAALLILMAGCATPPRPPQAGEGGEPSTAAARLAWTRSLGTPFARAPQIGGELIYLAGKDNVVYALAAEDGAEVWRYPCDPVRTGRSPGFVRRAGCQGVGEKGRLWDLSLAVTQGSVFIGVEGGALLALDADDGSLRWQRSLGINVTYPPIASGGMLFVPTAFVGTDIPPDFKGHARLFAVDVKTGEVRWQFETGNFVLTRPAVDIGRGVVYTGGPFLGEVGDDEEGGHTRVYALRLEDASLLWQAEVEAGLLKNLTAEAGVVSLMGYRDALIGLDAASGTVRWEFETGNWTESFTTSDGMSYLGPATSTVYALDVLSGQVRWRYPLGGAFNYIIGEPAIAKGRLYFITTHSQIVCLDAGTGEQVWTLKTEILARAPLTTDGERLYVAGTDGRVYAFDLP